MTLFATRLLTAVQGVAHRVLLITAAFMFSLMMRSAIGHEQSPPWLDEAMFDDGLYVEVRHPRVIRQPGAFDLSVVISNLHGQGDVTVKEIRYQLPRSSRPVARRHHSVLASKRSAYRRYRVVRERLRDLATKWDRAGIKRLYGESRRLLVDISSGVFRDSQRVAASLVPRVGSTLDAMIEVDVLEAGRRRTLRRSVEIPVQPPLPTGNDDSWFAGDQHLHTAFSIDAFLLDGTNQLITDYAATAQILGLDWIIITDHTNVGFNVWYQPWMFAVGELLAAIYRVGADHLVLQGQEMGVGSIGWFGEPAHLLVYPRIADTTGFLPNPCSGLIFNHVNCEPEQVIIDRVNNSGGIGFIAHPFDSSSLAYAAWNINADISGWAGLEIFNSAVGAFGPEDQQSVDWWHELLNAIQDVYLNAEVTIA